MGFEVEDGGMESTSTLFEKVVPVRVTKCNSEDRHMDLTARFVMGLSKVHRATKVSTKKSFPLVIISNLWAYFCRFVFLISGVGVILRGVWQVAWLYSRTRHSVLTTSFSLEYPKTTIS